MHGVWSSSAVIGCGLVHDVIVHDVIGCGLVHDVIGCGLVRGMMCSSCCKTSVISLFGGVMGFVMRAQIWIHVHISGEL